MSYKYLFIFLFVAVLIERSLCQCQDDVCSLELVEPGRCRASIERYGYDGTQCRKFIWGGCDDNGNNFEDLEQCQAACKPGPDASRPVYSKRHTVIGAAQGSQ